MIREAVRLPVAPGVNVKPITAFWFDLMVSGRVGGAENAKSEALAPVSDTLETTRSAVPGLLIVSGIDSLEIPFN